MSRNDLDIRMKRYEESYVDKLIPHIPIVIRIDGKAFHSFTRKCVKPFDAGLSYAFQEATKELYAHIGKFDIAYGQSDEVSILIYNPDTRSQEYFDGKTFKICSIVSSVFTYYFNKYCYCATEHNPAFFDCRVFQIPEDEVVNYFIWRQKDASRNSVEMLGRHYFSHKELHKKNNSEIQDMLMAKHKVNWNNLPTTNKRGWCIYKTIIGIIKDTKTLEFKNKTGAYLDEDIPIFTKDRDYIERHLEKDESA